MKKFVLAALVAGSIGLGVPAADAIRCTHPGPPPEVHPPHCAGYEGGCSFAAVSDPTPDGNLGGQGAFTGEVDWQVVLYDAVNPANNPVSATVSCELEVNGVVQDSTVPTSVTVAGAGADVLTYNSPNETDVVALCTVIVNWSNGLPNVRDCGNATTTTIPPDEVIDLINLIFDEIGRLTAPLDPITCDAIKTAGLPATVNSVYGTAGIWIDPDDCDIWVNGPVWENIFITPARLIDFVPYSDPYTGPA